MPATAPALRGVHPRKAFPPPVPRPTLALWPDLATLENDDLAWALFFLCRRVQDVATAPRGSLKPWRRADDVRHAATGAPEIASELRVLAQELEPGLAKNRSLIAKACQGLADWAAARARGELAIQFSEAAMAVQPGSGRRAFEAAKMNRYFSDPSRAEVLYSRAICLARAKKRWWVYVRSHLGIGLIQKGWGNRDRAKAHASTAASAAWKLSGERWLAGLTEHDLLVLTAEAGEFEAAFQHAVRAFALMPVHNERVPALVHDYCLLLVQMGFHSLALPLLESVCQVQMLPAHKVIVWGTLARAAGGLRYAERFRDAERHVQELAPLFDLHAAAAYANLATGAYALGYVSDAEHYALQSIGIATARAQAEALILAEPVLRSIRRGDKAGLPHESKAPTEIIDLAQSLAARLAAWRGPTWKHKRGSGADRLGRV